MNPFGKEKANNIYFNAGNGELSQTYPEPQGWDGKCDFVQGTLTSIRYYFDEGKPEKQVEPGMRLDVWLAAEVGGVPAHLVIRAKCPNTFTRMVASHMPNIKAGDTLKFRVWAGTDNQKVTVCMIDRLNQDTGAWDKVPRVELPKTVPPRTQGGKPDTAEKDARVDEIFKNHPAWRDKAAQQEPAPSGHAAPAPSGLPDDFDPFGDE